MLNEKSLAVAIVKMQNPIGLNPYDNESNTDIETIVYLRNILQDAIDGLRNKIERVIR